MQTSFFDLDNRYAHLSKSGDPLEPLNAVIDWELFRPVLNQIDDKERNSNAGRKPADRMLMFKMLVLQNKYKLSHEQLEFQVTDRLSFARFLGVMLEGSVPIQRNSKESNEQIKAGKVSEHWAEQLGKECQKDMDARWTKKAGKDHYGYKNHINIVPAPSGRDL